MYKHLLLLLLAGTSLLSCSKDDPDCDACQADAGKVDVTFQFKTAETKSVGTPPRNEECDKITNFQIFIFNDNNQLESSMFFDNTSAQRAVTMKALPGIKDFYAVANYGKSIQGVSKKEDLAALTANLTDNSCQKPNFLMVAQQFNKEIKKMSDNDAGNDVYLEAERLVSRIQLRYKLDFSNSNYKDKEFYVDSVYVLNANTKCTFTYANGGGKLIASVPADGLNNFHNPFLANLCETGKWVKDGSESYPGPTIYDWFYFYTFPNQPEDLMKATKIVISAILDGSRTYYPIIVNKSGNIHQGGGVQPNHTLVTNNALYIITATIKGRGGDDPETPIEYIGLSVNTEIKEWSDITQETDFSNKK